MIVMAISVHARDPKVVSIIMTPYEKQNVLATVLATKTLLMVIPLICKLISILFLPSVSIINLKALHHKRG